MGRFLTNVAHTIGSGDSSSANRVTAEAGLESPLMERAEDAAVAGVLSLDRLCPYNDAAVEMGPPVIAAFPSERWAYGLLFPLDHVALKANQDRAIIVRCDLVVEAGLVGIMGVYEDIARGLGPGLAALTGRRDIALRNANRADDKPYAALYREFRARFRIPADLVMEIYDGDPYLRHFYTDEELTVFKAKWTAARPLGPPER